jgi:hypothetical protein
MAKRKGARRKSRTEPKVLPYVLTEYVGVERGSKEYVQLYEKVKEVLSVYPRLHSFLDVHPRARLEKLDKLRKAIARLIAAEEELDEGARWLLTHPPLSSESLDFDSLLTATLPEANIEAVTTFAAKLNLAIDAAVNFLGDGGRQRPTLMARDITARLLITYFERSYKFPRTKKKLDEDTYRYNLDSFLRHLLRDNGISYPEEHQDPKTRDAFLRQRFGAI